MAKHIGFDADQDCSKITKLAASKKVEFVGRYLKNLKKAEVVALSAAGLSIVSIFESTAKRALTGHTGGYMDGQWAIGHAVAIGQPTGTAIYFTADFGELSFQDPMVYAYCAGVIQALNGMYALGMYGEGALYGVVHDLIKFFWLAGGGQMRGTPGLLAAGTATIVQDVGDKQKLDLGINIDSDTALVDDFGRWRHST